MKDLNRTKMESIKGGIPPLHEYCATAQMIIENNDVPIEGIMAAAEICGW